MRSAQGHIKYLLSLELRLCAKCNYHLLNRNWVKFSKYDSFPNLTSVDGVLKWVCH